MVFVKFRRVGDVDSFVNFFVSIVIIVTVLDTVIVIIIIGYTTASVLAAASARVGDKHEIGYIAVSICHAAILICVVSVGS